jgi:hypothetical protein
MLRENVEIVRRSIEAWNGRGFIGKDRRERQRLP